MSAAMLAPEAAAPKALGEVVRRFAALGDSFTAGRGPDGRRWTEVLAGRLARANPGLVHCNLAHPGATSGDVLQVQVAPALEFAPDLVTVVCGANDVLLAPHPDVGGYAARLKEIVCLLRAEAPGVLVVTATCPNAASRLPLTPRVRDRLANGIELLNEVTRSVADRLGAPYVDFAADRALRVGTRAVTCSSERDSAATAAAFARTVEEARVRVGLGGTA